MGVLQDGSVAAADHLGGQWQAPAQMTRAASEYPVKGWRKAVDRTTATQRLMGATGTYQPHLDALRKGITPSLN